MFKIRCGDKVIGSFIRISRSEVMESINDKGVGIARSDGDISRQALVIRVMSIFGKIIKCEFFANGVAIIKFIKNE